MDWILYHPPGPMILSLSKRRSALLFSSPPRPYHSETNNMSCNVSEFIRESLVVLDENIPVAEGARQMAEHNLGSVIVTRADQVVGLFTEQDLVKRVVASGLNPTEVALGEVCSRNLVSISSDATCREALLKMRANGCFRLLVYRGSSFLGLVKLQDLAHGIAIQENRSDWLPNAIVGVTLTLVLGVIVLLIFEFPDMLHLARRLSGL
jgi:signal-transduction protein with cAMP-binding, CBS, and nucleotidyltransferase domain